MSALPAPAPAPGSMAAHDALVLAYTAWRGAEGDFETRQTADVARAADASWMSVIKHAINCGMALREPCSLTWVRRRIGTYGRTLNREVEAILLVGEPVQ